MSSYHFCVSWCFLKIILLYVSFSQRSSHDRSSWQRCHLFNLSSSLLRLVFQKPSMGRNCWTLAAGSTDSTGRDVGSALKFHFVRSAHFSFVAPDSWGCRSCSSTYLVTCGWILRYLWQVHLSNYKAVLVWSPGFATLEVHAVNGKGQSEVARLSYHWWTPRIPCVSSDVLCYVFSSHIYPSCDILCRTNYLPSRVRKRAWAFLRIC